MDAVTAKHEAEIRETLAMFAEVIELHKVSPNSQEVSDMTQDILGRAATVHGIGFEIADTESDSYRDAVNQLQLEVFHNVDAEGNAMTYSDWNEMRRTNPLFNNENLIAALIQWPPQFRNVALAVNLARAILKQGIMIEMDPNRPVEFPDGTWMKSGWKAFYYVFGNAIRAA